MVAINTNLNLVINVNKPVGITSYDVVRELKKKYPGNKIGHAGTLDPLADGVLIALVGKSATKRQAEFMNNDKVYIYDILFGFDTDTYDILGLVSEFKGYDVNDIKTKLKKCMHNLSGEFEQDAPQFSAIKIDGKPLYRWYLDGEIEKIRHKIPVRKIYISQHKLIETRFIKKNDLSEEIYGLLDKVKKGFRQSAIKKSWEEKLERIEQPKFLIATLEATVSKGTYVRGVAQHLGQKFGCGACTMTITRTRVGDMKIEDSRKLNI